MLAFSLSLNDEHGSSLHGAVLLLLFINTVVEALALSGPVTSMRGNSAVVAAPDDNRAVNPRQHPRWGTAQAVVLDYDVSRPELRAERDPVTDDPNPPARRHGGVAVPRGV